MPEAISTQNLVTLPITSQELGRGGAFLPPNQNRTIKSPNHYRVKESFMYLDNKILCSILKNIPTELEDCRFINNK